jgi:hypothetical protein
MICLFAGADGPPIEELMAPLSKKNYFDSFKKRVRGACQLVKFGKMKTRLENA